MIDPITLQILQEQGVLEGYCLKCALCGKQVEIVKDGEGEMSCCNKRMFVMSGSPQGPAGHPGHPGPASESEGQQKLELFLEKVILEQAIVDIAVDEFEKLDILESKEHLTEEELIELKKTRNILQRAVDTVATTGYAKRKRDLMRLRKKTTPGMRKKLKDTYKTVLKKKPGLATLVSKAKKVKGVTKTQAAALRREVGKRLGGDVSGYVKMGRIKDREETKQARRGKQAKKAIRKQRKERKAEEKAAVKYFRKTGKWRATNTGTTGTKKKSKPKRKTAEVKGYGKGGITKKKFNPAAYMSVESKDLHSLLDKAIAECEADFNPNNQPEAQERAEKQRASKKKVSEIKKGGRLDKTLKKIDKWSKEGTFIKKYVPADQRSKKK